MEGDNFQDSNTDVLLNTFSQLHTLPNGMAVNDDPEAVEGRTGAATVRDTCGTCSVTLRVERGAEERRDRTQHDSCLHQILLLLSNQIRRDERDT